MLEADVEVDRREFTVRAAIAVKPGERIALFGPSGAGKTTLLETIAGLVRPRAGTVSLAGRILTRTGRPRVAVPPWQRRIGLLRQDPGLFPHLSVRANLCYAGNVDPHGDELSSLAAALGLGDLLGAMPVGLSGGQQHRAALARLLLAHCDGTGCPCRSSPRCKKPACHPRFPTPWYCWWRTNSRTRKPSLPRWR